MDLIDYHIGRRESPLPGVKLDSEVPRLWAALIEWAPDWDSVWRQCDSRVDAAAGARALERTAFAMVRACVRLALSALDRLIDWFPLPPFTT